MRQAVDCTDRQDQLFSNISMLVVTMIWGMNFVAMKTLFTEISPGNLILFRFFSAAVVFLALFFFIDMKIALKDFFHLCLLGATGVTLYQFFWIYALKYTSVINASIIIFSAPLCTALLAPLVRGQGFRLDRFIAVTTGFVGIYIVIAYGGGVTRESHSVGDLLALAGSLIWSLYTLLSRPLLVRYSPLKVTVYSIILGSLLFCPFVPFLFSPYEFSRLSFSGWLILVYTVVFSVVLAFAIWYRAMSKIGPSKGYAYQYLIPAFAGVFACVLLDEKLYMSQIVGGLVVFGSIAIAKKM